MTDTTNEVNHLALWEQVEKTDPAYTKEFSGAGGFSGTAINVTYLVKKATEILGPLGLGWGYEILEERYDTGAPLFYDKQTPVMTGDGVEVRAMVHTIKLKLWYHDIASGERCELTHFGHTPYVFTNKYGVQTDMEAGKKSLTDALKKCLSMLGFAGDIFMGLYDDVNYVEHLGREFNLEKAEDRIAAAEAAEIEYRNWRDNVIEQLTNAVNLNMLLAVHKSAVRKASLRQDNNGIKAFEVAKNKRLAELQPGSKDQAEQATPEKEKPSSNRKPRTIEGEKA